MRVLSKGIPERRCTQENGEWKKKTKKKNKKKKEERVQDVYRNGRTENNRTAEGTRESIKSANLCDIDEQRQFGVALHRILQILI